MINYTRDTSEEDKKRQTLNIAGHEISVLLDTKEPYAVARERFELLRKHCLETL